MTEVAAEFWVYPLRHGDVLPNFDWMPLYGERLRNSGLVARALRDGRREDIATAVLLWAASMKQNPAGSLPDDDVELAHLSGFGVDVEGWRKARSCLALYGWRPVEVEDAPAGACQRLGHVILAEIAKDQYDRKRGRERGREHAAFATMKSRVRSKLREIKQARVAENDHAVDQIAQWLRGNDLYVTNENVRVAMDDVLGIPKVVSLGGGSL